jgi:uncharacterized protein (DUF433 family)
MNIVVQNYQLSTVFMKPVVVDPDICNGQPVLEGTRIAVQTILEFLGAGDSIEDVLEEYPTLTRDDILGCLRFSAELLKHQFTLRQVA